MFWNGPVNVVSVRRRHIHRTEPLFDSVTEKKELKSVGARELPDVSRSGRLSVS